MNFDNYKFRCSSLGKIMSGIPKPLTENQKKTFEAYDLRYKGEGRPLTEKMLIDYADLLSKKNAKPKLSDGAKTYLEELVWNQLTHRSKELQSKFLDKGIQAEERSITLYSNVVGKLFIKNKERKENEFLSGECDNAQGIIRDIKSSWEWSTFPVNDRKITNSLYEWQGQGYMWLWGLKKFELIYCLVDTPERLILDDIRRLDWKYNITTAEGDIREDFIDMIVELVTGHIYTEKGLKEFCNNNQNINIDWFKGKFREIPEEMRIKIFKMDYNPKMINQAKEMIVLAREYMNNMLIELSENIEVFNEFINRLEKVA